MSKTSPPSLHTEPRQVVQHVNTQCLDEPRCADRSGGYSVRDYRVKGCLTVNDREPSLKKEEG